jgi:hypothetical protein
MKVCPSCLESKPLDCFGMCKRNKDGKQCYCRECKAKKEADRLSDPIIRARYNERAKERYHTNPESRLKNNKKWRLENSEKVYACKKAWVEKNRERVAKCNIEWAAKNEVKIITSELTRPRRMPIPMPQDYIDVKVMQLRIRRELINQRGK